MLSVEDEVRQTMRAYQRTHGLTLEEYARELGVGIMTVQEFLAGDKGLPHRQTTLLRAIWRRHGDLERLIRAWLDGGAPTPDISDTAPVAASRSP